MTSQFDISTQVLEKLDQLISAVLDSKVKPRISIDKALWSLSEVSDYLGLSYRYVSEYIVTHHTFPEPVRLKFKKEKRGHPRYYAGEVIDWVSQFQEGKNKAAC